MSNSNQLLAGIFESMRVKELFYQSVSAKNLHQIDSMKVETESKYSETFADTYSGSSDSKVAISNEEKSNPDVQEESEKLELILRQSLGQKLDFKA